MCTFSQLFLLASDPHPNFLPEFQLGMFTAVCCCFAFVKSLCFCWCGLKFYTQIKKGNRQQIYGNHFHQHDLLPKTSFCTEMQKIQPKIETNILQMCFLLEGFSCATNFLHEKHQSIAVRKLEYYELLVLFLCILKQPVTSIVYLKEWFATFLAQKPLSNKIIENTKNQT